MIKAESLDALKAMLEPSRKKAETMNPVVAFIEFRHYQISGSKGNIYNVFLGINPDGEFWIACQCRAGLEGKNCYHACFAFDAHLEHIEKLRVEKKRAEREAQDTAPYFSGGSSSTDKPDKCGNIGGI